MEEQLEFWPPPQRGSTTSRIWKDVSQETQIAVRSRLARLIAKAAHPEMFSQAEEEHPDEQ